MLAIIRAKKYAGGVSSLISMGTSMGEPPACRLRGTRTLKTWAGSPRPVFHEYKFTRTYGLCILPLLTRRYVRAGLAGWTLEGFAIH